MLTNIISFLTRARDYLKQNPIAGLLAVFFMLLLFLFFLSSLFSSTQTPSQDLPIPTAATNPSGIKRTITIAQPVVSNTQQKDQNTGDVVDQPKEDFEKNWEYSPFEETDLANFEYTKTYRPDGAVVYSIPSENPNRPNIMIVKGNVTIVNRTIQFDTTMTDIINFLGKPDYVAEGSLFWGKSAAMYIYFNRGLAYTADAKTKKIFEQMEFMPVLPKEFKSTYGEDLIGDLKQY